MARLPSISAVTLLEEALRQSGVRWRWEMVRPRQEKAERRGVFQFDAPQALEEVPCKDVPGAELALHIECGAWQATAFDTAAFPDEVERLLEDCPAYPAARAVLPALPVSMVDGNVLVADLTEQVEDMAQALEAGSKVMLESAAWLREAMRAIEAASDRTRREGEFFRKLIGSSSFGEWHISGVDQHANTLRVAGRDLRLSMLPPTGTREDLDTFHVREIFEPLWKAAWKPLLNVEAADYGTRRVAVSLGRGARRSRYWLDLAGPKISRKAVNPGRTEGGPRSGQRPRHPRG